MVSPRMWPRRTMTRSRDGMMITRWPPAPAIQYASGGASSSRVPFTQNSPPYRGVAQPGAGVLTNRVKPSGSRRVPASEFGAMIAKEDAVLARVMEQIGLKKSP